MTAISGLVLAAGMSVRMGKPKMALPWRDTTIIGAVIQALRKGGIDDIVVVTGGNREAVEAALVSLNVRLAYNPDYAQGEMLSSFRTGLRVMPGSAVAVLVTLGDQPQILAETVQAVLETWAADPMKIVMPSYQMRRGHPWVLPRRLWADVKSLPPQKTMRDFLRSREGDITYVEVDTPTIIADIDTPEEYRQASSGEPS